VKDANIRVRRVYESPSSDDGLRVLVDRIWPRGLRKDGARLDEWARDIRLRLALEQGPVTLLTATRDLSLSQATVLAELLSEPQP
jgi:uncharacterized protein YeaO (DUF488 family)